jgi:hypothetical protein
MRDFNSATLALDIGAFGRDLDTLSFDAPPYGYDDAAESLGRITDALIDHDLASLGPIIIIAPATDAIANVIAVTVANLLDWRAFDDDVDPAVHLG